MKTESVLLSSEYALSYLDIRIRDEGHGLAWQPGTLAGMYFTGKASR